VSTVYISFHSLINETSAQHLIATVFNQIGQGATEIVLMLSTPGGSVTSGITIFNALKAVPVKVTTHNIGNIDSIGNAIFLAGTERYASSTSTFMFHGVGFDIATKVRLERKNLEEYLNSLVADETRIGRIIADETSLELQEVNGLFVQAETKDADWALAKGIIHKIEPLAIPQGATVLQLII